MEPETFNQEYFQGKQKRGVLTLSNRAFLSLIRKELGHISESHHVLEIGCAYGAFSNALSEFIPTVTGIDISEHAISQGRQQFSNLDLRLNNFESDPLPADFENAFDSIVSLHTFEHFHQPEVALRKTYRCLKPGGRFFLIVPNPEIWIGKALKLMGKEKAIPVFGDQTHFSLFNQREWAKRLADAGFRGRTLGRPFYIFKHPLLDKIYPAYYTESFQRSGFELLFLCEKP